MSSPRQDFLLQQYTDSDGSIIWDFPLEDTYINGVIQPTPYGDSDNQHKIDIIVNNIGALKQFPLLGFGLFKYLNSETQTDKLFVSLSNNMKMDGYTILVGAIKSLNGGGIDINTNLIVPNY